MTDRKEGTLTRRAMLGGVAAAPALVGLSAGAGQAADAADAPAAGGGRGEAPNLACVDAGTARVRADLAAHPGTAIVLLGTGAGPVPGRARHMTSVLMRHGDRAYMLDFGLGAVQQFARTGVPFGNVRSMFLTHMHPDHNVDYGPFLLIGWVHGLRPDLTVFGPTSMAQMTQDYLRAMKTTIDFWAEDFHMDPLARVEVRDMAKGGPVMQDEVVKVSAILVQHPPVKPAFAYRFDFTDRSIVFSGDTVPLDAVADFAKGADVLVHEAMFMPAVEEEIRHQIANGQHVTFDGFMHHMLADHSPVEDVGRIAEKAGVKTLVLYHLTPSVSDIPDADWSAPAARSFKGRIVVGGELMVI